MSNEAAMEGATEDPYSVLYLLPSAPHELVMEVYWQRVHQLRAARGNPGAAGTLAEINRVYAALCEQAVRGTEETPEQGRGDDNRRPQPPGAGTSAPAHATTPHELLHVVADAPQDVVELAYEFFRQRFRGQEGPATRLLARLQTARGDLLELETEEPPEMQAAPSPESRPLSSTHILFLRPVPAIGLRARAIAHAGRRLIIALAVVIARASRAVARFCWAQARAYAPRLWRWTRMIAGAAARTAGRSVRAGWQHLLVMVRDWSSERLSGHSGEGSPRAGTGPSVSPDPLLEERVAAMGRAVRSQPAGSVRTGQDGK